MAGSLLMASRADAKMYVSQGGFEEEMTLRTPTGTHTINLKGLATKHHLNYDTDGNPINSTNAHICIVESDLVSLGYPVRNASGKVSLNNHLVNIPDSSGTVRNYIITENLPNETIGIIVCILGDYKIAP